MKASHEQHCGFSIHPFHRVLSPPLAVTVHQCRKMLQSRYLSSLEHRIFKPSWNRGQRPEPRPDILWYTFLWSRWRHHLTQASSVEYGVSYPGPVSRGWRSQAVWAQFVNSIVDIINESLSKHLLVCIPIPLHKGQRRIVLHFGWEWEN